MADAVAALAPQPALVSDFRRSAERPMPRSTTPSTTTIEQVGRAIAKADGTRFEDDPERFQKLALAALQPLARPTESMVDAAHAAVEFDDHWAINRRAR